MNKKEKPFLVQVAILTAITTLVWIGFSVYKALTNEPEPTVSEEVLAVIQPTLETDILENLETRLYLNDEEIGDTVLINNLSPATDTNDDQIEETENEENTDQENQESEEETEQTGEEDSGITEEENININE